MIKPVDLDKLGQHGYTSGDLFETATRGGLAGVSPAIVDFLLSRKKQGHRPATGEIPAGSPSSASSPTWESSPTSSNDVVSERDQLQGIRVLTNTVEILTNTVDKLVKAQTDSVAELVKAQTDSSRSVADSLGRSVAELVKAQTASAEAGAKTLKEILAVAATSADPYTMFEGLKDPGEIPVRSSSPPLEEEVKPEVKKDN